MMMKKSIKVFALFLGVSSAIHGSGLLLGDRTDTTNSDSFSFNLIKQAVYSSVGEQMFVASGAALTGDARQYALAGTSASSKIDTAGAFIAFAPEKVTLNGTANTDNPLFGAQIIQLGISGSYPIAVKSGAATTLQLITSSLTDTTQTMVSATGFKDANTADSAGVITAAENTQGAKALTGDGNTLFVAVKPNGSTFGKANGGIAVFTHAGNTLTQEKAVNGDDANIKAVEIALDTAELKLGAADLTLIQADVIDMHWDGFLQRLYIGVRVADAGANGARAVVIGRVDNQGTGLKKLRLIAVAPTAAFTAATDTEIIGNTNANEAVEIYNVRTMHTSTGLSYLIVRGDASGTNPTKLFFALPLVDESADPDSTAWKTSTTHGTIAKKSSTPTNYFKTGSNGIQCFQQRGFQTQATAAGDLPLESEAAAKIGGGAINGTVSDMEVYRDTVFVSTNVAGTGDPVGIFYSQAIFDSDGKIADWTPWERVTYHLSTNTPEAFAFAPYEGKFMIVEDIGGATDIVRRTVWGTDAKDGLLGGTTTDSAVGFIEIVNGQFPFSLGGVMGLFNFDSSNPAFKAGADGLSLMVVTGYKKVLLAKASAGTNLTATIGDFTTDQRTFTDGAIDATSTEGAGVTANTAIVTVSGGDLDDLEAITSATIVEDAVNGGYLAVGGVGGVALLRTAARAGWATGGLDEDFSTGLGTTLSFQKIGTYANVRKLWTAVTTDDTQALYILTDDSLFRIDATDLNDVTPTHKTLATLAGLGLPTFESFADFIASKTLGLLATSAGLYRTGNGQNISTAAAEANVGWAQVTLPDSYTGITKLIPLGTTELPYEFADGAKGQVYYVASTVSYLNAAVGRLAITDASTSVGSTTVTDVSHPVLKNSDNTVVDGPFTFLGAYRGNFATNGATLLATSPQQLGTPAKLMRLPLATGPTMSFSYHLEKEIDLALGNEASAVLGVTRSSATGSWLVYGDFGLRVLE